MDATREVLIAAGVALVDERGIDSVGVRAVASAAGLSHGAPRRHFPTLAALLAAIARTGVEDLDRDLRPALCRNVGDAAVAYWRFSERRPHMFELIFRHDVLDEAGGELRAITSAWLEALGDHFDEPGRAIEVWAAIHGLCALTRTRAIEIAGVQVDEHYVRSFVEGIAAVSGRPVTGGPPR